MYIYIYKQSYIYIYRYIYTHTYIYMPDARVRWTCANCIAVGSPCPPFSC